MAPNHYFEIVDDLSPYYRFSYFDTGDNLAMLLFDHYHVDVTVESVYGNEEDPYRIVLCRIPREQREGFMRAAALIPAMMAYAGHSDYEDYCRAVMLEAWRYKTEKGTAEITPLQ